MRLFVIYALAFAALCDAAPRSSGGTIIAGAVSFTTAYVCNNVFSTTPNPACYFLTPAVNGLSTGTPTTNAPGATFTCNGVTQSTPNPACIYQTTPMGIAYQGFLTAGVQYQCGGTTSATYNPECTYNTAPSNNILVGTIGNVYPTYSFVCNGQTTNTYNSLCTYPYQAVNNVFYGTSQAGVTQIWTPPTFVCNGVTSFLPSPACHYLTPPVNNVFTGTTGTQCHSPCPSSSVLICIPTGGTTGSPGVVIGTPVQG
ncbi:mucin-5B-like isoform X2 [Paramacrobiotus metropolitanus]|uniref:mucin-5B-like isoform X2 n=1 Tax=Paramacrobiotus metropolitanus TaxID=2943436 RepID=UPI002445E416|nr:mucin-5B-like isoform X2 [Paramacrobiotus metropolitanus]